MQCTVIWNWYLVECNEIGYYYLLCYTNSKIINIYGGNYQMYTHENILIKYLNPVWVCNTSKSRKQDFFYPPYSVIATLYIMV